MSPKQEDLQIKTDTEVCIFLIVSQANYALLRSFVYQARKEKATGGSLPAQPDGWEHSTSLFTAGTCC